MRIFPIIPIWIMTIISILLMLYIIKFYKNKILYVLVIILLFIINLRIMIPTNNSENLSNDLDVLFVIDSTISMNAEDYNGNNTRLSGVKNDCNYIIDKLNGARFSVITFNNSSKRLTPFTRDINITKEAIEIIEPVTSLYAKGSSLNIPIEDIKESFSASDNRKRIIFFISDGEITNGDSLNSFSEIKKYVSDGAVLGYGTSNGGKMKAKYTTTQDAEYIKDYTNEAISKIDETNLKKIADDIDIEYINMSNTSNIDKKLNKIKKNANNRIVSNNKSSYKDTYYIFIFPLIILISLIFKSIWRKTI